MRLPAFATIVLSAALSSAAAATPSTPAAKVPLDAFVRDDPLSNPRLSPDGKHIVLTALLPGGDRDFPAVMVYSVPDMKLTGAIRLPKFEVPLDTTWVSDSRLAIEKGKELGSRERPVPTGEVLAADIDGSKQEYLFGYDMYKFSSRGERYDDDYAFGTIEDVPPSHNGHLYLSSHPWEGSHSLLYDINAVNATRKLMADIALPDLSYVMDHGGTPRYAAGDDQHGETVLFRRDADGNWRRVEGKTGRYRPFAFTADDHDLFVRYSEGGGPDQLVRENLQSGKRVTLFDDPAGSFAGTMRGPGGQPFAAYNAVGQPQVAYFDPSSADAQLHKMLASQFPGEFVHFIDFSADGNALLFSVSSDRDPGSYYLFDRRTAKAALLFSSRETIDPDQMAARRPIAFPARDGVPLYGFLTMPPHPAGTRLPLVLLPHGGPHGPYDNWFYDNDAQFLASRGYAVLQVNFRGSGGRGRNFEAAGYREWAGKIMDDLVDGVRWTVAQGEVDPNRMCVYGASFGGYAALMLAAREPDLFKCAVGYVGVYDLNLLAKPQNDRFDDQLAAILARYVGTDKAELDRDSPVTLAGRIKAPVLLIHGGKDKRAPVEHAEEMRAALVKAGHPPEWFLAPNEGHGFYDTANLRAFYEKLEAFLGTHLGPPAH